MKTKSRPDYNKIYSDIIRYKHPQKKKICEPFLRKKMLTGLDIIKLNEIIFEIKNRDIEIFNQRHRSYTKVDTLQILKYQEDHNMNNTQLASHFKLSRNTIAKWKKVSNY